MFADALHSAYSSLLAACNTDTSSHNLLVTQQWMMVVPRVSAEWAGTYIDALAFAGVVFFRREHGDNLVEMQPLVLLSHLAGSALGSSTGGASAGVCIPICVALRVRFHVCLGLCGLLWPCVALSACVCMCVVCASEWVLGMPAQIFCIAPLPRVGSCVPVFRLCC